MVHLLWIGFVIFGALITRRRPMLAVFHVAALVWGAIVEAGPWPCPLTTLEQYLQAGAGMEAFSGSFLLHYLERIVYPDIPPWILTAGAAIAISANAAVYVRRYARAKHRD